MPLPQAQSPFVLLWGPCISMGMLLWLHSDTQCGAGDYSHRDTQQELLLAASSCGLIGQ